MTITCRSTNTKPSSARRRNAMQKAQVSNYGRYRNRDGVVTTPKFQRNGYARVEIDGKSMQMHRLVASAFEPSRDPTHVTVKHKDGNPLNNRADNLEWVTLSQSIRHSYQSNRVCRPNVQSGSDPICGRKYIKPGGVDTSCAEWTTYANASEAARILELPHSSVIACCIGKTRQTSGYEFKIAPRPDEPNQLPGEEWRVVPGNEHVSVSSFGRFRCSRGVARVPKPNSSGYVHVMIERKLHLIHRLVASAFNLPRKTGQDTVNHIDHDPSNNRVENLEWVSRSESIRNSCYTTEARERNIVRRSKPVRGRKLNDTTTGAPPSEWLTFASANEAARRLGLNVGNISTCCRGRKKQTEGYEFEYDKPNEPEQLPGEKWRDVVL